MTNWLPTLAAAIVAEAEVAGCVVAGQKVALYCVNGQFYATADRCTHGEAKLSEGYLEDGEIECPLHKGMFDVRTGAATNPPCSIPVQIYAVKVVDGFLHVGIEEGERPGN